MRRRHLLATALLASTGLAAPRAARAEEDAVDLQLVLAVDSSSSVSMDEYYLQLEGYARAFANPLLWEAIGALPLGRIAVALFEWSGPGQQVLNFEWRILDGAESTRRFAEELALAPRLVIGGETAIGDALAFAAALLEAAPGGPARMVVDVSGDGSSNRGLPVSVARAALLARGVVVNGLAVTNQEEGLESYYAREVIGGPGSFVLAAGDYDDFRDVILRKLLREIGPVAEAGPAARIR
ncbi:MAG: DUF1194 domain-containing protein [Alphaproteobacteria bacterium]|nr:DUF1194 domain-containing protein [Alphaproteobacteria bacterium]